MNLPEQLKKKTAILFFIILFGLTRSLWCQCLSYPAFPGCSPAGAIALVSGASINTGQTHVFSGTSTFSSLTLNGGTLIVCGNLTLNAITVTSGTIFVQSGASLTASNGGAASAFGANVKIYNFGRIDFKMSIVTGASNTIINCLPTSQFLVTFDQFVLQGPNTFLVNNGTFNSSYFIVQSNNSPTPVCMGVGSILKTSIMINQFNNSITTPLGSAACVNVTNMAINSSTVTASNGIHICIPNNLNVVSGPNWGAAIIENNCAACAVFLPIELVYFAGYLENNEAVLQWQTLSETNNCLFEVEKSDDGLHFVKIAAVNGATNSSVPLSYQTTDTDIRPGKTYYYRLKQIDCDFSYNYSGIIDLKTKDNGQHFTVYPNPTEDVILIKSSENYKIKYIDLYNTLGELVVTLFNHDEINLKEYSPGIYFIKISEENGEQTVFKVQKR